MTYFLTAYNTHPTLGHITTIQKTLSTTCKVTAETVMEIWEFEGYEVEFRSEG